jgi:hypothetical protein
MASLLVQACKTDATQRITSYTVHTYTTLYQPCLRKGTQQTWTACTSHH